MGDDVEDVFDLGPDVEADDQGGDASDEQSSATRAEAATDSRATSDPGDGGPTHQERDDRPQPQTVEGARYEQAAEAGVAITTDDAKRSTRYSLPETWESLDDFVAFEVRRELRDRGIRDATDNEISDAMNVVIQDYAEEVAEQVVDRRLSEE